MNTDKTMECLSAFICVYRRPNDLFGQRAVSEEREESDMFQFSSEQFRLKVGLAEMLKGGVIMDVTNAEQAKIAEDAGASAVMALERVPSDIRKEGGVARMANIEIMEAIMKTVH